MTLPKQVEQQIREVEELEKQLKASADNSGDTSVVEQKPATKSAIEAGPEYQAEPISTPVAEQASSEDWRHKYNTLKGKYDAEVPRLHRQVAELTKQLEALQVSLAERERSSKNEVPVSEKLVTDADKEAYGEDLIDLQRRVAREEIGKLNEVIAQLREENAELKRLLSQTGNQVNTLTFEQVLRAAIPDFPQINSDPRWIEWLNEYDPILRAPRRVAAQRAYDEGDVEGVKHYIDLWRQSVGQQDKFARQAELQRQQAPSRSAASSNAPPGAKVYTSVEIDKMWAKVRDLNIKGRYDEAAKLEAEITAAFHEGRVKP